MRREYEFRRRAERDAEAHQRLVERWYSEEEFIGDLIQKHAITLRRASDGALESLKIPVPPHLQDYRLHQREALQQGIGHDPSTGDDQGENIVPRMDDPTIVDKHEVGVAKGRITVDDPDDEEPGGKGREPGGDSAGDREADLSARQQFLKVDAEEFLWRLFQERYDLPFLEELTGRGVESDSYSFLPEERRPSPERFLPLETFREYLKRIAVETAARKKRTEDNKEDGDPIVVPIDIEFRESDIRVRTPVDDVGKETDVVLALVLDRTGSMGEDRLLLAKTFSFFLVLYLHRRYSVQAVRLLLVLHDTEAHRIPEENEETFWDIGASGGTRCSSGWVFVRDEIRREFTGDNVYLVTMSDGLNAGNNDNEVCVSIAEDLIKEQDVRRAMYIEIQNPDHPPREGAERHPGVTEYYLAFHNSSFLRATPRFVQHRMRGEDDLRDLLRMFCTVEYEEGAS